MKEIIKPRLDIAPLDPAQVKDIISAFSYFYSLRLGFVNSEGTTYLESENLFQEAKTEFRDLQILVHNRNGLIAVTPAINQKLHVYRKNWNRDTVRIEETLANGDVFVGNKLAQSLGHDISVKLMNTLDHEDAECAQFVSLTAANVCNFDVLDFHFE